MFDTQYLSNCKVFHVSTDIATDFEISTGIFPCKQRSLRGNIIVFIRPVNEKTDFLDDLEKRQ